MHASNGCNHQAKHKRILDQAKAIRPPQEYDPNRPPGVERQANTPYGPQVKKRSFRACGSSASTQRFAPRD